VAKARILAVDEQLEFRVFLEELLCAEGYEVEAAASGAEALQRLESSQYDVVLCDIVMPGMSGAELVQRIQESKPEQEVVVLTGESDVQTAVEAMRHGATDYLLKPISKPALLHSLDRLRRQRRLRDEHARLMAENLEYLGVFSLYERAIRLFSALAPHPLADRIAEALSLETGAQGALVWIAEESGATRARLMAARGIVRVEEEPEELQLDPPPAGLASLLEGGTQAFFGPTATDDDAGPRPLYVPLVYAGRLLGVVRLTDKLMGAAFSERDHTAAGRLGEFAGVALANALRFHALEQRSFRDARTKAYTAAYFEDVVRNEIQKANRFGRTFSLLRVDLDEIAAARGRLSEVELGRLVEGLAQQISSTLRATDLLAAEGDERFLLLLPETDGLGASILKRRIREAMERAEGIAQVPEGGAPRVTLGSVAYPSDGTQLESLKIRLEERTEEDRRSLLHRLDRSNRSFGGTVAQLLEGAEPRRPEMAEQITRYLFREILRRPHERGVLLLAPGAALAGPLRQGLEVLRGLSPKTEIVLVADRGGGPGLPVTWVSPVRAGTDEPFLVYCSEGPAYALIREEIPEGDGPALFHSSDRSLVEHLAFELGRDLGIPIGA
jgi:diguanylate cyclase (GGDEF)-like protein